MHGVGHYAWYVQKKEGQAFYRTWIPIIEEVWRLFSHAFPDKAELAKSGMERMMALTPDGTPKPLGNTGWTTCWIGQGASTYHDDSHSGAYSLVLSLGFGIVEGVIVMFPGYGFGVYVQPGDAVLMRNEAVHGSTQRKYLEDGRRFTLTFYCDERIALSLKKRGKMGHLSLPVLTRKKGKRM